ncbi:MAG: hypothetical protein Q4D04_11505 [Clostridia bacterium]|nr:hypothetical protein [Clostridia bacterium]
MNKPSILFSPIGKTDPVREGYDGPMLHILRHYRPNKVIFFLTAEIERIESKCQWNQKFARAVLPDIEIELMPSGIEDASDFEAFIRIFEKKLMKTAAENPDARLMVNISSGSPQMTSALCVLASSLPDLYPIQVKTPEKKSNANLPHEKPTSDIEPLLASLIDHNLPDEAENRCVNVKLENYVRRNLLENLRSQINLGAYEAALGTVEKNRSYFSDALAYAINGAHLRKQFCLKDANNEFSKAGLSVFHKMDSRELKILEFYLGMRNDFQRGDFTRFFVRLSPLAEALAAYILRKRFGFDMANYTGSDGCMNVMRLKAGHPELVLSVEARLRFTLDGRQPSLEAYNAMIFYFADNGYVEPDLPMRMDMLRSLQKALRNYAAHEMSSISTKALKDAWERGRKGNAAIAEYKSENAMLKWMDRLFLDAMQGSSIRPEMLASYESMNRMLTAMMFG